MICSINVGVMTAGETLLSIAPTRLRPASPVVMVHGAEGGVNGAYAWLGYQSRKSVPSAIMDDGRLAYSPELGGNSTWGNSVAQSRMDDAYEYIGADKIALHCQSMGAVTGLVWAANNPDKVSGIILVIPALDLNDLLGSEYAGAINSAYGGAYSDNEYGAYNPILRARAGGLGAIPIQCWFGKTDALCKPQFSYEFIAITGAEGHGIDGGHAESTVSSVIPSDVSEFLSSIP